ncbi:MAG: hypothetical protein WAW17_06895 [Rhodococcus sp. (in: high G+C Gram-positive bacteria)]|uniref:hypothetical protein n=1 Tax=Rhodococcus sp. TaxID=1831 RepID=UPI003BB19E35
MTDSPVATPTEADIEALANNQVQRRIETGKKVAATLAELTAARTSVASLEAKYKDEYSAALDSSWTAKELSSLGIEPLKPKRARRSPNTAARSRRSTRRKTTTQET